MITLSPIIAIPDLNRARVRSYRLLDDDTGEITVEVGAAAGGGRIYGAFALRVTNGPCVGLRATAAPVGFRDTVELFSLVVPTAFTDIAAAAHTGANEAARRRNIETALIAAGLLPAGTVA